MTTQGLSSGHHPVETMKHAEEPPQSPLRVGLVGTGHWARWCHAGVLAARPDIELVGVWGRDLSKAQLVADETGCAAFDDFSDLVDSVDAMSFAIAPAIQAELAVSAAEAGRHLLLDKPLALDVAAAEKVADSVNVTRVASLCFMTMLFQDEVRGWLERMTRLAEEHGRWEGIDITCAGAIDAPGSPYAQSEWRHERGGLWDWGPHALSIVLELLPPLDEVVALRGVRDIVHVTGRHVDGALSSLTLTVTAPPAAVGTAVAVWGPAGRHTLQLPTGNLREAYSTAVDEWIDCMARGEPHRLDANYGLSLVRSLALAEARASGA